MTAVIDIRSKLFAALDDHRAGRLDAAAAAYRAVLTLEPSEPNALQLLGVIERGAGRGVDALFKIARAAAVMPGLEGLPVNIENAVHSALSEFNDLMVAGSADAAGERLSPLIALLPENVALLRNAGAVRLIQGREAEARAYYDRMVALSGGAVEPSGLSVALEALERRRQDYGFVGTVVIPSYNAADYLPAALDSIVAAVEYARANGGGADFKVHVALVDDRSPDNGVDVARAWMKAHPEQSVTLLHNNQNRGAGASRNLGAAAAFGRYLWFLDADDRFLENHLLLTARSLDERPHVGYVRTGIEFDVIDDRISDEWRQASEFTYPCSMAVRRECHDLIGGFPTEAPFGPAGPEDVAYSRALAAMFVCAKTAVKTVFYTMRPGNILEKLFKEMMEEGLAPNQSGPADARFTAVEILIRRRLHRLEAKRGAPGWSGPPRTPDGKHRVTFF